MKTILTIIYAGLFFAASCKKLQTSSATVIRDCTGTYLRMNGKDNPVCNYKIITEYTDGSPISVDYKKVVDPKCEETDLPRCEMIHPYELGVWIEIIKIK
ncbi:MAG: hypothetical protein JNK50_01440 [Bacteroidia bacterium]|nr:hypothetical protein [Bacteroidia bacterium]